MNNSISQKHLMTSNVVPPIYENSAGLKVIASKKSREPRQLPILKKVNLVSSKAMSHQSNNSLLIENIPPMLLEN